MQFSTDIFSQFDKKWALVTAGDRDSYNMMTVSWGSLGTLWGRPVATVYVRESRHTHAFLDARETFTVSFYPESCKKLLAMLGTKSGRDMDKMHVEGLTPRFLEEGVTFEEAEVTLVCRKLFVQRLDLDRVPAQILDEDYRNGDPHDMYIAEVTGILRQTEGSL